MKKAFGFIQPKFVVKNIRKIFLVSNYIPIYDIILDIIVMFDDFYHLVEITRVDNLLSSSYHIADSKFIRTKSN